MTFRNNTTSANTAAVEDQIPADYPPIYAKCAEFTDCNSCTYEYDDFVSVCVNISYFASLSIQNCGFCYEEDQSSDESANGQGQGSCVPWEWPASSREPMAVFGRYVNSVTLS